MSIADRLLNAFNAYPQRTAIVEGHTRVSYRQLRHKCLNVAAYIQQAGLVNSCIAVELDDLADHVIAILGVVMSGNYYVSVTPENKAFLADSNLPVALTIGTNSSTPNYVAFKDIVNTETSVNETAFAGLVTGDMPMCAFFTSGSTGKSKAIVHRHKNILTDTLRQINDNQITANDKLDLVFSLSFSASLACIYPALLSGAGLCLFSLKTEGLNRLAEFWKEQSITFTTLSVTSFHGVCKINPSLHQLTLLRFISISAEPVKDTTIRLFRSTFGPDTTLQIAYASTETRTISEMKIANDNQPIPYPDSIGQPVADKTVLIADEEGNYLPADAVGEIVVRSKYIANAYYGQPAESARSFTLKDGFIYYRTGDMGYLNQQGYLFYQGRLLNEQKLNGIKINLLDIEQVVESLAGILQVAVVINKPVSGQPRLVCFYTTDTSLNVDGSIMKKAIAGQLPSTHVPQFYIALPEMPLTHSGKIDRKQLEIKELSPAPAYQTGGDAAGTNADEQVIADIFKKVLQTDAINADTDFFDAGGDSLTTLLCIAEIEAALNIKANTTALVANPTPCKLSAYLRTDNKQIFEIIPLNGSTEGKTNLYFLDNARNNRYNRLVRSSLSDHFNLIEIIYDIYARPVDILDQLALFIGQHKGAIVVGHSFHGYVAHQLACMLPQIAYCVLLDTYDYFDYDKYELPETIGTKVKRYYWHVFKNKDFKYPAHRLIFKYTRYKRLRSADPERLRLSALHKERINRFLADIHEKKTINHCIYFQGSRTHQNLSNTWRSKVGGRFYYQSLICTHSNVHRKKAAVIADNIIKITQANGL